MLLQLHNNNYNTIIIKRNNYMNINYFRLDDDLESHIKDLPPPCYDTPVITDIKAIVERTTLGSGGDGGGRTGRNYCCGCGEKAMLGSDGDEGGRTGRNCGGCG